MKTQEKEEEGEKKHNEREVGVGGGCRPIFITNGSGLAVQASKQRYGTDRGRKVTRTVPSEGNQSKKDTSNGRYATPVMTLGTTAADDKAIIKIAQA